MAVKAQRPSVAVSEERPLRVVQKRPARLHEEILPPELAPATPATQRRAKRSILVLALLFLIAQPFSVPVGRYLTAVTKSNTDAYSAWEHYVSSPVPDVLVIGASTGRTDVDEPELGAELSNALGRPVTVEKMGFAGQTPLFFDAITYKVMERPVHPKLIVVMLEAAVLNSGCGPCLSAANPGLWEVSDLSDPGFVQLALNVSPNPAMLVAGWAVPSLAYYPSALGVQCLLTNFGRSVATQTIHRIPIQLQNPTICESLAAYKWGRRPQMTTSDLEGSVETYGGFMQSFQTWPKSMASLSDLVARAKSGGTKVVFMQAPLYSLLRDRFPQQQAAYLRNLQPLEAQLGVADIDMFATVPDDPSLWVDGIHLNRAGADYIGPSLARQLAPYLAT